MNPIREEINRRNGRRAREIEHRMVVAALNRGRTTKALEKLEERIRANSREWERGEIAAAEKHAALVRARKAAGRGELAESVPDATDSRKRA